MTTRTQAARRHAKAAGPRVPARRSKSIAARTGIADVPRKEGEVDAATRHEMIACAAYFRAERRGFAAEGAVRDWLEAEAEIDRLLHG